MKGIGDSRQAIGYVVEAIRRAGFEPGRDIFLALDVAATSFFNDGAYDFEGRRLKARGMTNYFKRLKQEFPFLISIEDGLAEDDWSGWKHLTRQLGVEGRLNEDELQDLSMLVANKRLDDRVLLVADDLFVTQHALLQRGIERGIANVMLTKKNQNGTLTGTLYVMDVAIEAGFGVIPSHRSGETTDTTIADLAFGTKSLGIKTGAPRQRPGISDAEDVRRVKYLRMIELEQTAVTSSSELREKSIDLAAWDRALQLEPPIHVGTLRPIEEQLTDSQRRNFLAAAQLMLQESRQRGIPTVDELEEMVLGWQQRLRGLQQKRDDLLAMPHLPRKKALDAFSRRLLERWHRGGLSIQLAAQAYHGWLVDSGPELERGKFVNDANHRTAFLLMAYLLLRVGYVPPAPSPQVVHRLRELRGDPSQLAEWLEATTASGPGQEVSPLEASPLPVLVLIGPSASGTTTLLGRLQQEFPDQVARLVEHHTRPPRPGEVNGVDYFFMTPETLEAMEQSGEFVYTNQVYGFTYGLSKQELTQKLEQGKLLVLSMPRKVPELERLLPGRVIYRYVSPVPDAQRTDEDALRRELLARHEERGMVAGEDLEGRLRGAVEILRGITPEDQVIENLRGQEDAAYAQLKASLASAAPALAFLADASDAEHSVEAEDQAEHLDSVAWWPVGGAGAAIVPALVGAIMGLPMWAVPLLMIVGGIPVLYVLLNAGLAAFRVVSDPVWLGVIYLRGRLGYHELAGQLLKIKTFEELAAKPELFEALLQRIDPAFREEIQRGQAESGRDIEPVFEQPAWPLRNVWVVRPKEGGIQVNLATLPLLWPGRQRWEYKRARTQHYLYHHYPQLHRYVQRFPSLLVLAELPNLFRQIPERRPAQFVALRYVPPAALVQQVHEAFAHPHIRQYIGSEEFHRLRGLAKLDGLIHAMRFAGIRLETAEPLVVYAALPAHWKDLLGRSLRSRLLNVTQGAEMVFHDRHGDEVTVRLYRPGDEALALPDVRQDMEVATEEFTARVRGEETVRMRSLGHAPDHRLVVLHGGRGVGYADLLISVLQDGRTVVGPVYYFFSAEPIRVSMERVSRLMKLLERVRQAARRSARHLTAVLEENDQVVLAKALGWLRARGRGMARALRRLWQLLVGIPTYRGRGYSGYLREGLRQVGREKGAVVMRAVVSRAFRVRVGNGQFL